MNINKVKKIEYDVEQSFFKEKLTISIKGNTCFKYDSNNNEIEKYDRVSQFYKNKENNHQIEYKYEYEYDLKNNVIKYIEYSKFEDEDFQLFQIINYKYDSNNNKIEEKIYGSTLDDNEESTCQLDSKRIYMYDKNNNEIEVQFFNKDPKDNSKFIKSNFVWRKKYDINNNMIEHTRYDEVNPGEYNIGCKICYTYDINNNKVIKIINDDGKTSKDFLEPLIKFTRMETGNDKPFPEIGRSLERYEYKYDSSNNLIKEIKYDNNTVNKIIESKYDSYNNKIEENCFLLEKNIFGKNKKSIYQKTIYEYEYS